MKPEYKRKAYDFLTAVNTRVTIIDEMLNGRRPVNETDAKRYMKELQNGLSKIKEILDIS